MRFGRRCGPVTEKRNWVFPVSEAEYSCPLSISFVNFLSEAKRNSVSIKACLKTNPKSVASVFFSLLSLTLSETVRCRVIIFFLALLIMDKCHCTYLECKTRWFDIHIHYRMIIHIRIINPPPHRVHLCVCAVRTLRSTLSHFQVYNTLLLTIVTVLSMKCLEFITEKRVYPLTYSVPVLCHHFTARSTVHCSDHQGQLSPCKPSSHSNSWENLLVAPLLP